MKHSTLKIPQQIDFGFCPVGETTSQEITVTNLSRDSTTFIWLSKDPFKISPQHGTILGKKQQQFRVDFLPDIATRFNGTLVCRYGTELLEKSIIEVNGISKIPHITLSTNFIDFGRIPSSAKSIQTITVHNSAPVPATVTITSDFPQFIVQPTVIHLKPEGSSLVKILFHPTNFDFFAFANITFSTAGGNSATTRCRAYVTGPTVTIDRTTLSLGSVHLKSTSSNIFNISNHSDRRILFQFLIEPTSVFRFDPIQGILPPNYSKAIRVTFSPQHPIVYHRRVILVIHQHHPMAIDVFGSAFDTFNHPPKIKTSSVEKYYQAIAQGLGSKPPRAIKEFTPIQIPEIDYISNDLKRNLCTLNSGVHIFDELFIQKDLVTISPNHFDFGACQRDISPEPKTLTVKNNTDSALTLFWEKNSDGFVNVEPEISEIPKNQKVDIIVKFNPLLEFQFMGTMLEGFAQFKEMRNSNIVNFITLPFVLTPFCNGHTMDDVTSFIPTMYTSHKTLIFSGAIIGDSKYQTFYVENRGDCAFKFDIRIIDPEKPDKDSLNSSSTAFNVYPRIGTIDKGSFQIFVVKFNPTQKGHYHSQIFATINDSPLNFFNLNLKGDSSIPTIKYSVNGTLFLHPISLGSFSNQIIQIFNESTIPIKIEWKIPTIYNRLLMVKPNSIEVRSKEVIDCEWIFHPNTIGEFKAEVICNVQSLVNSSNTYISKDFLPFIIGKENIHIENSLMNTLKSVQHYPLTISTLVTDCIIDSKPKEIDFGYVRINSISSSTLIITNHSDSQMKFVLRTKSRNSKIVMFNPSKDILPARSSREIEIRFQPNSSGLITDSIMCSLIYESLYQETEQMQSKANEICLVKGIGCFPHLSIIDIFSTKYSRNNSWINCNINLINEELNILKCDSLVNKLKTFEIDFGSYIINSKPTTYYICFKNVGHISFNFSINFPNDINIDPEYWALPDEIDNDKLKQDQIIQAKLFKVNMKKFFLNPNETITLQLTYYHKYIECHQLPIILSIQNGRIIKLLLKGKTLNKTNPYLIPQYKYFEFQQMPIGSLSPPIQTLKINNFSNLDANYQIDLTQVNELNENNHNFEIIKCLNPFGIIKRKTSILIKWIFKPLEAKEYEAPILVTCENGNNFTVNLKGKGIHTDYDEYIINWPIFPPNSLSIQNVSPIILSEQFINFGDIPIFVSTNKIIYMQNISDKSYEFIINNNKQNSNMLKLEPKNGIIEAGEKLKLILKVNSPNVPLISFNTIPIIFTEINNENEIDENVNNEEVVNEEEEEEFVDEIIAIDPPINSNNRINNLKMLKQKSENWESVIDRTFKNLKNNTSREANLFSSHIGKREENVLEDENQNVICQFCQFIDVVFDAITENDYRNEFGSVDTFYFDVQNPKNVNEKYKDEIGGLLMNVFNEALADEQLRKYAMKNAEIRQKNIPYFQQLYKEDENVSVENVKVNETKIADDVQSFLRDVIDEIVDEACEGKFSLENEIVQISGFKTNK